MSRWPEVALGEVLRLDLNKVDIDPSVTYPMVGVYSFGRGLFDREPVEGTNTSYRFFYRLDADHIVMSQLFGWEGALAISSKMFAGKYLSPQFPTFRADTALLDLHYLGWFMRRPAFWEELGTRTKGMGDRRRTLNPEALLVSKMPLPPIEEQRRVVRRVEQLAALTDRVTTRGRQSTDGAKALESSMLRALIDAQQGVRRVPLRDVIADLENGWSPQCHPHPAADGEWGVLKLGAVSFGQFDSSENKQLPDTLRPRLEYEIRAGDVLISRANTLELVGASVYVESVRPRLMLCDKIFRVLFRPSGSIDGRYLSLALKSPDMRDQIEARATGTSPSMKNIPKSKLLQIMLPVPSLAQQQRLVAAAAGVQSQLGKLQVRRSRLIAELEALVSSSLAQAFPGEAVGRG